MRPPSKGYRRFCFSKKRSKWAPSPKAIIPKRNILPNFQRGGDLPLILQYKCEKAHSEAHFLRYCFILNNGKIAAIR